MSGETWIKMKTVACPFCGQIHHLHSASDPPPRCNACMKDVAVPLVKRYVVGDVHNISGRGQVAVLDESKWRPDVGESYSVTRGKEIRGKVLVRGVEMAGAHASGVLLEGISVQEGDVLSRTTP